MGGGGVLEESPGRLLQVRPLPCICCQSLASPARRSEKTALPVCGFLVALAVCDQIQKVLSARGAEVTSSASKNVFKAQAEKTAFRNASHAGAIWL